MGDRLTPAEINSILSQGFRYYAIVGSNANVKPPEIFEPNPEMDYMEMTNQGWKSHGVIPVRTHIVVPDVVVPPMKPAEETFIMVQIPLKLRDKFEKSIDQSQK